MLLLFQVAETEAGRKATVHVIDSAPGVLSLAQREKLYQEVRESRFLVDTDLSETLTWTLGLNNSLDDIPITLQSSMRVAWRWISN